MRYSLLFVYQALFVDMSECLIAVCQVLSESLHKTHGHKHRFFNRSKFDVRNMSGAHLILYLHGLQRIEFTR